MMEKITIKDITFKNIKSFIEGYWYDFVIKMYNKRFKWIEDIALYRQALVKDNSPQCLTNGACVKCGCTTPQLFLAAKGCKGGCYDPRPSKTEWQHALNTGVIDMDFVKLKLKSE